MNYLKRFNESFGLLYQEVQDFCETHLSYLIDDGLEVKSFEFNDYDKVVYVSLKYRSESDGGGIRNFDYNFPCWNDVKDNMIPFFTHLSNRYDLCKNKIRSKKYDETITISYCTIGNSYDGTGKKIFNSGRNLKTTLKNILDSDMGILDSKDYRIIEIYFNVTEKAKPNRLDKIKSFFKI